MKHGRQIIVAPQPKTVEKLHLIDKTIARLAKEMDDVQRAKISADEKWRLMKYKLGNYLDLVTQVKQPYLRPNESDDDDIAENALLEPIRVKQEELPRTSLKVNPFSPQKKKRSSPSSSKKKTSRPSYNLRMRKWQPMYK